MKRKRRTDQRSGPAWSGNGVKGSGRRIRYPYGFRMKAVRLHLEEGYNMNMIAQELGCTGKSVQRWVECYNDYGEAGLRRRNMPPPRLSKGRGEVDAKIRSIREKNPHYGPRRISDILRRLFLMKAAPSQVHRTLKEADMIPKPARMKAKKNPAKPRFFERSTPNQMWQSDIMSFRMNNKAVYLIGYIDDCQWNESIMLNVFRRLLDGIDGDLKKMRYLIMDRDPLFTHIVRTLLQASGIKPLRYRPGEPLMNIYAERFVKSIKHECIEKLILVGESSLRKAVSEYVIHYNEERNHQGIDNQIINPRPGTVIPVGDPQAVENQSEIEKTGRLGDMLNFYYKKAS